MEERLQKILSQSGVCSRRRAEEYLAAGRVTVNGVPARIGDKADPARDRVEIDGKPISFTAPHTYLMLYKPRGYVTTLSDELGRKTVAELVSDCPSRVWPVGRLDMDSEGLLLMTDDGAMTHRLTHPSHEIDKVYTVWVLGDVKTGIKRLQAMNRLEGESIKPPQVRILEQSKEGGLLSVTIHEGKNRQIRRMCAAADLAVTRLKRVQEGKVCLGGLMPGQWRHLSGEEIDDLSR